MKPFFQLFLLIFLVSPLTSCHKKRAEIVTGNRGELISQTKVGSMSSDEIIDLNKSTNDGFSGDFSQYAKYNIDIYSIEYKTLYSGNIIKVSGLVMIPTDVDSAVGLIQYHHGTTIPVSEESTVPSRYCGGSSKTPENHLIGPVFASNGYVVSYPDYVGYGASNGFEHTYNHHYELSVTSIDMLRATKELMNQLNVNFNSKVMLTGWSEGGGAGMAVHKYLQLNHPGEFNVVGSSLLAGPYDYRRYFMNVMENRETKYSELDIHNWSLYSLNKFTSTLKRPKEEIWTYNVKNQRKAFRVKSKTPSKIYTKEFIDGLVNGTDTELLQVLDDQNLINGWTPESAVFFHSGTHDFIVDHFNSENAYNKFLQDGANVTLYTYENQDHYEPLVQYIKRTLDDFSQL